MSNNTNNVNNIKKGICFVNCDEAYYQNSLEKAAKDCVPFAYDIILKQVYSQDVGIDEINPDIPKGIEYKFNHILVNCNKWIQPDIDEEDGVIDITYITDYAEQYTVLIDKRELKTFAFQKFLRDGLIYTLSSLNRGKFSTTNIENVRMYRDMRTLINFCNKYRSLISIPKRNKPLDRVFNQRFMLIHTKEEYYKFALAELPVNPIDDATDSMSIFNSIKYDDVNKKMPDNVLSDITAQQKEAFVRDILLDITTQEEALVKDSLSDISDKLCYYTNKLKRGVYPLPSDVIITDIKNMGTALCSIANKYKDYSSELGQNFYQTAYAMLHVLKVISYAYGKPIICEAFDKTVSFTITIE